MLSIYKLNQALTESASGTYQGQSMDNIVAYDFGDVSFQEAAMQMANAMMSEAADNAQFTAASEEILVEAVLSSSEKLDILSENVAKNAWAKLKAIIDKIIAMIKGLIDKIKAQIFKMAKKGEAWAKVMRPKIEAVKDVPDVDVEVHNWDVAYISKDGTLIEGIKKLCTYVSKRNNAFVINLEKGITDFNNRIKSFSDSAAKDASDEAKAADIDAAVREFDKMIDELVGEGDKKKLEIYKEAASAFGVSAVDSNEELWSQISKKVTGGEKTPVKVAQAGGGPSKMLEAVESSTGTLEALKKAYDEYKDKLVELKRNVDKAAAAKTDESKDTGALKTIRSKYNNAVSSAIEKSVAMLTIVTTTTNTASAKHQAWVKEMMSEYMHALSVYVSGKGAKKEDKK